MYLSYGLCTMYKSNHRLLEMICSLTLLIILIPLLTGYVDRMTRKKRSAEAIFNLNRIADSAKSYYIASAEAQPNWAPYFPDSVESSPFFPACQGGVPVAYDPQNYANTWQNPTWVALQFNIDQPFYFQYGFISQGSGINARFTARAQGDLNCDAIMSSYEITGHVTPDQVVKTSLIWTNPASEFQ